MRIIAGIFCLSAAMAATPAFGQAAAGPQSLSGASDAAPATDAERKPGLSFGFMDRLVVNRGAERPSVGLAPIERDQLALNWRPGGKWGITLDMTSRSQNEVLPREEVAAGAYYQVTPRFRFGGGVTFNGDSLRSAAEGGFRPEDGEAGVKIESAFSF
jgi:hypothetical protein